MATPPAVRMRMMLFVLATQLVALWSAWLRAVPRYDESQGALAVLSIGTLAFMVASAEGRGLQPRLLRVPGAMLVAFGLTWGHVPGLASCVLATTSVACTLSAYRDGRALSPGILLLSWCALPWLATADFLAGWPLRVVSTEGAALLARVAGGAVHVNGACLTGPAGTACVDAPCAGVRMLGTTAWLVAFLAARGAWGWGRTAGMGFLAVVLVVFGNALRAASLFIAETRWPVPGWFHEAVGLVVFSMVAAALAWLGKGGVACAISPRSQPAA